MCLLEPQKPHGSGVLREEGTGGGIPGLEQGMSARCRELQRVHRLEGVITRSEADGGERAQLAAREGFLIATDGEAAPRTSEGLSVSAILISLARSRHSSISCPVVSHNKQNEVAVSRPLGGARKEEARNIHFLLGYQLRGDYLFSRVICIPTKLSQRDKSIGWLVPHRAE